MSPSTRVIIAGASGRAVGDGRKRRCARNAGILAVQILGSGDAKLQEQLFEFKASLAEE